MVGKTESFHRSRRMFVILDNNLLLAEPNLPDSHEEWLRREGVLNTKDYIENNVRGFIDKEGIYGYIGRDFRTSEKVEKLLVSHAILRQFIEKVNTKTDVCIFTGMNKSEAGGKYQPQKYLGKIIDFLEK